MGVPRLSAVLVVVVLLLAGCVVSEDKAPKGTEGPASAPDAAFSEDTGGVKGTVVTDETSPIAGAAVSLSPLGVSGVTASDGSFSFSNIAPGRYTVFAASLGYEAGAQQVEVLAGEVKTVTMILSAIAIVEPRTEVYGPFNGFMQCRMSTPLSSGACGFLPLVGNTTITSVWTNDKVIWNFGKFTSEDFSAIVFESRWTPSSAATNPNMNQIFSYDGRPGTHWWADVGSSSSPINLVWIRGEEGPGGQIPSGTPDEHKEPTMNHTLRTWITIPFASVPPVEMAYEMRFEMMVTVYYSSLPPEGYSAFADA
jgi:hypothetical protein